MTCPSCRSEYRPGIVRCPTCDVPLQDLNAAPARERTHIPGAPLEVEQVAMGQFCGFFTLDEARAAREQLRAARIQSDILIRDASDGEHAEEFWLRVPIARMQQAEQVLGFQSAVPEGFVDEGDFACSDCGKPVAEEETSCSHCGAKFDE
jgi:hypothetical protein